MIEQLEKKVETYMNTILTRFQKHTDIDISLDVVRDSRQLLVEATEIKEWIENYLRLREGQQGKFDDLIIAYFSTDKANFKFLLSSYMVATINSSATTAIQSSINELAIAIAQEKV